MKKVNYFLAVLLLFTAQNFISCSGDVEPIDPAIVIPTPEPECSEPTAFQVSDFIGETNVNLSWVAGATETAWQIQYGPAGFELETGTIINTDATNKTIGGLNPENSYQFYVRSHCSLGVFSDWIGPMTVNATSKKVTVPVKL